MEHDTGINIEDLHRADIVPVPTTSSSAFTSVNEVNKNRTESVVEGATQTINVLYNATSGGFASASIRSAIIDVTGGADLLEELERSEARLRAARQAASEEAAVGVIDVTGGAEATLLVTVRESHHSIQSGTRQGGTLKQSWSEYPELVGNPESYHSFTHFFKT